MKRSAFFLVIFLIMATAIIAGCSTTQNVPQTAPVATPTKTLIEEPIIGSWMTIGDSTLYYVFKPDGHFQTGELKSPGVMLMGKWSKTGEGKYRVIIDGASDEDFTYVPTGDYIFEAMSPNAHATRYDKVNP
jgi:hypothetical protein